MNPVLALVICICVFCVSINCIRFTFKVSYMPKHNINMFDIITTVMAYAIAAISASVCFGIIYIMATSLQPIGV